MALAILFLFYIVGNVDKKGKKIYHLVNSMREDMIIKIISLRELVVGEN